MSAKKKPASERREKILQQYKDHKLTSAQAREEIKKLEAETKLRKKKR